MAQKPTYGFWQIWNMCFGFLGVQFGLALQNANGSRIFPNTWRERARDSHTVGSRAFNWLDRTADHRLLQRQNMEQIGTAQTVFFLRGHLRQHCACLHA